MRGESRSATTVVRARQDALAGGCPTGTNIVDQADGGLARIHLRGGCLRAAQAEAVGSLSLGCGNGIVELTNRGNLQLRGIRSDAIDDLQRGLSQARFIDPPGDDRSGLVVTSPLADLDPAERPHMLTVAAKVEAALAPVDRSRLAPKFAVLVDGGSRHSLTHRCFDVSLGPDPVDRQSLLVSLGSPLRPASGGGSAMRVDAHLVGELIASVGRACLDLADGRDEAVRVRDLIDEQGRDAVMASLADSIGQARNQVTVASDPNESLPLGAHRQAQPGLVFVAGAAVLGRLTSVQLAGLADLARAEGDSELRITPWRSVVIPHVATDRAGVVIERLESLGLCGDASDPAPRVVACSGSTGCAAGLVDAHADALRLIDALRESSRSRTTVQVSGCVKCCAGPEPTAVTLIGVEGGRYDVYRRDRTSAAGSIGARLAAGVDAGRAVSLAARLSADGSTDERSLR